MFRSKKGARPTDEDILEPTSEPVGDELPEAESPKAAPRRPLPPQARAAPPAGFPYELPRRGSELIGSLGRSDPGAAGARENAIIIGQNSRLQGELLSCDRLIVEGEAALTVQACRQVQIGEAGVFRGTFDVAEADISGDFEDDLVARERLTVRSTGRVRGRIRYRHIIIEAGGLIIGDVNELEPSVAAREAADETVSADDPGAAGDGDEGLPQMEGEKTPNGL